MGSPVNGVKPLERSRREPGKGSFATHWRSKRLTTPRIAIGFPPELMEKIHDEARVLGVPFAEIVRRRVVMSYRESLKPRVPQ